MSKLENKIIENVKKIISQKINESIELITEKWSISDEVDNFSEKMLKDILLDIPNAKQESIDNGLLFVSNIIKNYSICEQNFELNYYIYNCSNESLCDFVYKEGMNLNGYEEDKKVLHLTLYMINNIWKMEYCEKNVSHEIEHILQINYGFTKNENYKKLTDEAYEHANYILRQECGYSKVDRNIAWIVYYSNSHEQDAFMQEYARELRRNPSLILTKKSETHKIFNNYEQYCQYFLENKDQIAVKNAVKQYRIFGYNMKNFQMMATKQLKRFKKKMTNIEKNFKDKINR